MTTVAKWRTPTRRITMRMTMRSPTSTTTTVMTSSQIGSAMLTFKTQTIGRLLALSEIK